MKSAFLLPATALALCACQYVADLRPSDVSPRNDDADTADLDADAPDRDAEADLPRDPDAEGDPAADPDVSDVPGDDGGEMACTDNAQCNDGEVCNGDETCNLATGACVPGTNRPYEYPCDDENPCTTGSYCDGDGSCDAWGNACDDGLSCTTDTCTVIDPTSYECDSSLAPGDTCLIGNQCHESGETRPSNECEMCGPSESRTSWSDVPDGDPCDTGLCCMGTCRPGADCCWDFDCPMECQGTATPCSDFTSAATCQNQEGCSWETTVPPACTGAASSCSTLAETECEIQDGCTYTYIECYFYVCTTG